MTTLFRGALAAAFVLALAHTAIAQQETLEEKKAKKLAKEWLKKADWILEYDKALETSAKSGKPIFAYFTRSYAD